jgi:hypothetical protein
MKKLSILVLGLLLVSGFAFAQEFAPEVELSGSAAITFGVELNDSTTGFYNEATSSLTVTLVPEADATTGGDDGLYGEITIENFKFENGTATNGTVTAKIVVDPAEITIYSAPGFAMNMAAAIDVDTPDVQTTLANVNGAGIYGLTISIPVDPITVDVKVASDGDWTASTGTENEDGDTLAGVNTDGEYVIGTDVELAVDPATVTLGFTYGWLGAPQLGISAMVELALDVVEGLDAYVAFDGNQPDGGDFGWDLKAGATLGLSPDNDDDDSFDVGFDVYVAPYAATDDMDLDLAFSVSEPEAGGAMDMLYATVAAEVHDLLGPGDVDFALDVDGGYDTGDIDVFAGFGYVLSTEIIDLYAGAELKEGLTGIDNTTVRIEYVSTQISPDPTDAGVLYIKTTVSF